MITKLKVDNFKSLRNFELDLGRFSVLIGPNASGKSNILDSLVFLRDAASESDGVADAVRLRGSWKSIVTDQVTPQIEFAIRWNFDEELMLRAGVFPSSVSVDGNKLEHDEQSAPDTIIAFGRQFDYRSVITGQSSEPVVALEEFGRIRADGTFESSGRVRSVDEPGITARCDSIYIRTEGQVRPFENGGPIQMRMRRRLRSWIRVHIDFNAARRRTIRQSSPSTLASDGGNLATILAELDESTRTEVRDSMRVFVPDFLDYHVEELAEELVYLVDEKSAKGLHPRNVSDGTIALLTLLALCHSECATDLVMLEEPERGLHPTLMEALAGHLRRLSLTTQVIVTTHSPTLVDNCRPDEVVMLGKVGGATQAVRASETTDVAKYLENFNLGDLWTMGYLNED